MAEWYPWLVFAHLVGVVLFALAHGASMFVAFRVRSEREPQTLGSLLALSELAKGPMYIGLLLLAIGGFGAAGIGGLMTAPWLIASIVVVVAMLAVMYSVATPYYGRLREALGMKGVERVGPATVSGPELAAMLDTRRPEVLLTVGGLGLLILVWLMVLKPV